MPRKKSASGGGNQFYLDRGYEPVATHVPKDVYDAMMAAYSANGNFSVEKIARALILLAMKQKPTGEELFALLPKKSQKTSK